MSSLSPIYQKSIQDLKSLVFETLKEENVTVILFGSRARGDFSRVSDIDVGVLPGNNFDRKKLVLLKERIEDLNIPYTVDVVDLSRVSEVFKKKRCEKGCVETLKLRIETTEKALKTLKAITEEPYSVIVRDAAIQRFEYTSKTFWKVVKGYLDVQEGVICNSPKFCFKEAFKVGLLSEEETVKILETVDDRNLTSHTYYEEIAEEIYRQIRDYWKLMDEVCRRVIERIESGFPVSPTEK